MKSKFINKIGMLVLLAAVLAGAACKNAFDIEPEDQVDAANAFQTLADADAAVIGIYGKFANLSKQYIILNELRADLVDVTANADPYLQEINTHNVTAKNPYANPKPFYELIANCNDALAGFNRMVKNSKLSVDEYNRRYSDIGMLRSWLYLQVGIHYGSVPYLTTPLESPDQLKNLAQYPKVTFDVLLDSLIGFTSKLNYIKTQVFTYPTGNTLNVAIDGSSTNKFFITRSILMGDLYLWKGDYLNASSNYKIAMEAAEGNDFAFAYRVAYDGNTITNTVTFSIADARGRQQDTRLLYTAADKGWRSMFAFTNTNRSWNAEWYWSLPYSIQYATKNPLPNLFSKSYGSYLLKPSKAIIDNWNSQIQAFGAPGDPRGMLSYTTDGGDPVITKFTDDVNSIIGGGQWNIWRAGSLHLRFAESANRDGKSIISWGLLNNGLSNALVPVRADPPTFAEVEAMQTPFPEPYYFDARDAGVTNTGIRQAWSKNTGIRGRGFVRPLSTALQTDMLGLEAAIINENALELAFEGQRWSDLLRIARRRNDPSFLADKVFDKLTKAGNPAAGAVRTKLMNKDWYLPFDIYK